MNDLNLDSGLMFDEQVVPTFLGGWYYCVHTRMQVPVHLDDECTGIHTYMTYKEPF